MSIRNFDRLFDPRSVAVIGGSSRPGSLGKTVLENMAGSGYSGALWPLNPKYESLLGVPCYPRVAALPRGPDLALICTPPATIPGLIAELGARGTGAVVVFTPGLEQAGARGGSVTQAMLAAAKPHLLRILGPGGPGLLAPANGLNASVDAGGAKAGKIAFISQSAALMTAVLDWARLQGIGFSKVIGPGEGADIDLGDLLDYLAADSDTAAILLYMENIRCARKFMSAGRLAARAKPVIVLKAGRGADDAIYDAALRRAGMLRVNTTDGLFDAVETLARARPLRGERLAIVGNGAALGHIAQDALAHAKGALAPLSPATRQLLAKALPALAPFNNPLDLGGDAGAASHAAAVAALLREPQADALLLIHATTGGDSGAVAAAVAPLALAARKNVLSCWLGGGAVADARRQFADAGLPTYNTPEKAVRAFMQIVQYQRNQQLLMEVPAQLPAAARPERAAARALISAASQAGRTLLDEAETRAVLAAYGIAMAESGAAGPRDCAQPLHIGVHTHSVFGPVIGIGRAGEDERAVGLPPLNMVLARDMTTRLAHSLAGQAQAADAVCHALVLVSELVADVEELSALRIAPLQVGPGGVLALDARVELGPARSDQSLAIRPYPQQLEQEIEWQGAPLLLRPIKPEDAPQHVDFFSALAPDDIRLRFFSAMKELPPSQLARLTQIDYDRAMAFIATRSGPNGAAETLGVVRAVTDPDNFRAEFAIVIRSDLKGRKLGAILFQKLIDYSRSRGTAELVGEALSENTGMQQLLRRFGGTVAPSLEAGMVKLMLKL